jgi:hypothetical protein
MEGVGLPVLGFGLLEFFVFNQIGFAGAISSVAVGGALVSGGILVLGVKSCKEWIKKARGSEVKFVGFKPEDFRIELIEPKEVIIHETGAAKFDKFGAFFVSNNDEGVTLADLMLPDEIPKEYDNALDLFKNQLDYFITLNNTVMQSPKCQACSVMLFENKGQRFACILNFGNHRIMKNSRDLIPHDDDSLESSLSLETGKIETAYQSFVPVNEGEDRFDVYADDPNNPVFSIIV